MSIENAKAFYEKVIKDQDLFSKIGQIQKENPAGLEAGIVKTAAENKFEFTIEEMKAFLQSLAENIKSGGELSDDQLEAVAGGSAKVAGWCIASIGTLGIACAGSAAAGSRCNLN